MTDNSQAKSQSQSRRRGVTLIWTVLSLSGLLGVVGLASDTAYVLMTAHQLQNAADAAAKAGVQKVLNDVAAARALAQSVGQSNLAAGTGVVLDLNDTNAATGDIVIGRFDAASRTFTATLVAPRAVRVVARRTSTSTGGALNLIFGRIFGVDTVDVERSAVATMDGGTGAGLITLNETAECALEVQGSVTLDIPGGEMMVNSDDPCAFCVTGNSADHNAAALEIVGGACTGPNDNFDPIIADPPPPGPSPDPLALIPEPTVPDPSEAITTYYDNVLGAEVTFVPADGYVNTASGTDVTLHPGYYPGGIDVNGGTITLESGIYYLDGAGLTVGGNTTFTALGVMFYLTGTGVADLQGTGLVTVTPGDADVDAAFMGADSIYEGISIFQARDNFNESTIMGTADMDLDGTLYFPSNHVNIGGTGDGFGNQLIVDTMEIFGTGNIEINYDGRNPAPGSSTFLVD